MIHLLLLLFGSNEINYQRPVETIQATVTAYTLGNPAETDDTPCTGSSNLDLCELVKAGVVVYASNAYELGTELTVGGIKGIVLDRMNRRYQNGEIDIAFLDRQKALEWGRQQHAVVVHK